MTFAIWMAEQDVRTGEATNSYADRPSIAYLPNGGYVVGWRENNLLKFKIYNGGGESQKNPDGSDKIYSVDGGTTAENNLNIQSTGDDGGFVVSWNESAGPNVSDMKTRVFTPDAQGNYAGGAVTTVGTTTGAAEMVSVSARMVGGYLSTYTDGTDVYMTINDGTGAVIQTYKVHDGSTSDVDYPKITQTALNKYVVSYGKGDNIHYRIVTTSQLGVDIAEPVDLGSGQQSQVVALKNENGIPDGRFAVIQSVTVRVNDVDEKRLVAKFFDANGNSIGAAGGVILTNDANNDGSFFFDVTALRGGRIAVTYSGDAAITGNIVLKALDINGKGADGTSGPDTLVIDRTDNQYTPTITETRDGRLAIAWADPTRGQTDVSSAIVDPRLVKVVIQGTAGNDYYVGTEYSGDQLYGNGGDDVLWGGAGDDSLYGGEGADVFHGGTGKDTVSYADATREVAVYFDPNKQHLNAGEAEGDQFDEIDVIDGSRFNDTIEGHDGDDAFWANDGDDLLKGFGGNDTAQRRRRFGYPLWRC